MGTIRIKNLTSLTDKCAVRLVSKFWEGNRSGVMDFMDEIGIEIKQKGHTFTVLDKEKDR